MPDPDPAPEVSGAPVSLDRDVFLRDLLRDLSGTLEDVVGLEEASGFVSVVGQRMGDRINAEYRQALGVERLSHDQVAAVLTDLKRRIQGQFVLVESTPEQLVYVNSACPFAEKVLGRPSMCMMTSNVFGVIAAENLGQARVELQETIAQGSSRCRVVVHLGAQAEAAAGTGRQYFRS